MPIEESKYISLQEASSFCDYSQEYLSLRARQGKLKSVKFGRNWVTKKEWLEEYLERVKYNNNLKFQSAKFIVPPANLPIETAPTLRFGFVAALAFVLIITGIFYSRAVFYPVRDFAISTNKEIARDISNGVQNIYQDAQSYTYIIYQNIKTQVLTLFDSASYNAYITITAMAAGDIVIDFTAPVRDVVSQSIKDIKITISDLGNAARQKLLAFRNRVADIAFGAAKTAEGKILAVRDRVYSAWQFASRPWREDFPRTDRIVKDEVLRPKPKDGVVVVPHTEKELAQIKEQLKKAFSDRVEVEPDETGRTGIIRPLIKEVEPEEYLYLIVPVAEQSE